MTAPPPDPARTAQARELARDLLADPSRANATTDELAAEHPQLMPELKQELQKLGAIRRAFARASSSTDGLDVGAPTQTLDTNLPGYAIVGEIHRGGQGVVYRAIQNTTQREVAIKILREGPFAGRHDLERFDQEVRILAGLDHPNIVAIHDRGRSGNHDFFVMDYVPGTSLDEHVNIANDGERLGVRQTLELWAEVCEAVEAAHLRGVIHRDLKPGNVRVTPDGRPRVLDFGLAKQSDEDDSDTAHAMTRTGQFVGSLPWTSPEQAMGQLDQVDVRTDVYALGVIGYQLLTGEFPYRVIGPAHEVIERIRHTVPPPVSRRRPACNDEVDTIVARCLSKEPERRYQNAGELARDLRRYLAGEPIEAKRDSTAYVIRKLVARHRVLFAGAALLIATVFGSAILLSVQNQALRESREAERQAAATSHEIATFLQGAIASADPEEANRPATVEDLLTNAANQIEYALQSDPAVRVPIQRTIGTSFLNLGQLDKATEHLQANLIDSRQNLGRDHIETVRSLISNVTLARNTDQLEQAAETLAEAEEILTSFRTEQPEHREVAILAAQLAFERGDLEEAAAQLDDVLEGTFGEPGSEQYGEAYNLSGQIYRRLEDLEAAAESFERALRQYRMTFGPTHPRTLTALGNLANVEAVQGLHDKALERYERALDELYERLGADHTITLRIEQNYGVLLRRLDEVDRAREIFERLAAREHAGAATARAAALGNLAGIFAKLARKKETGAAEQADKIYQQAINETRTIYGPRHPKLADLLLNHGNHLVYERRVVHAASVYRKAARIHNRILPEDSAARKRSNQRYAQALRAIETSAAAAARQRLEAEQAPEAVAVLRQVADKMLDLEEPDRARKQLQIALKLASENPETIPPETVAEIEQDLAALAPEP